MIEQVLDQIVSVLAYTVRGVPISVIIGVLIAALFIPQVRQLLFTKFGQWATKKLGGGKSMGVFSPVVAMPVVVAVSICMLSGCGWFSDAVGEDDYITTTYKSLKSARIIYDEGMTAAAQLYKYGVLDEKDRENIIEVGDGFRVGWQAAVNALYAYALSDEESPSNDDLQKKLAAFNLVYAEFAELVRPYLIEALVNASDDD